jgi:hypothetical protein
VIGPLLGALAAILREVLSSCFASFIPLNANVPLTVEGSLALFRKGSLCLPQRRLGKDLLV